MKLDTNIDYVSIPMLQKVFNDIKSRSQKRLPAQGYRSSIHCWRPLSFTIIFNYQ